MRQLDFNPTKTSEEFHRNYRLHDLAEEVGLNLLVQWGFEFSEFGKDKRYEKLWEKGEDKPDMIVSYNGKSVLLDWKGKQSRKWQINERAVKSYENWKKKLKMEMIICFFVFDQNKVLMDRKFAVLGVNNYTKVAKMQWDKNKTVEFENNLLEFNRENFARIFE
ncbi:hypothetical protein ABRY23_10670 [Melioribacteraceae bacterium 4301-Me]|uniref:hypothetical protein n=1 Tax=Pyranulibacter aquaticus TaxID=3163344 RepID=UPI003594BB46